MNVLFSPQSVEDLWLIEAHISQSNPERGASFTAELTAACVEIGAMPLSWPLVPRYERFGYRRRPYRNYLICYEVIDEDRTVSILHVIHAARDYERLLFPPG
jgi:toxin ParE1/3/4